MAGISPLTMLLSKSGSRLLMGITLLIVQLPFTILAVALGGISALQIGATYVAMGAYLMFVCYLALFCSTVSPRSPRACSLTVLGLVVFFGLHLIAMLIFGVYTAIFEGRWSDRIWETAPVEMWLQLSPFTSISDILSTGFAGSVFTMQVISNALLAVIFFVLSRLAFNRCARNADGAADEARLFWRRGASKGGLRSLVGAGRPQGGTAALSWKDFHFISGGWRGVALRIVLYTVLTVGAVLVNGFGSRGDPKDVFAFMFMSGFCLFPIEVAALSGRVFQRELKWQTLSSLAMLPIDMPALAWNKIGGMLPALVPGAIYFGIGFLCYHDSFFHPIEILAHPMGWFMIFVFVLYVHLTAFMSLIVRFGAAALALAAVILGLTFSVMLFSGIGDEDAFGLIGSMICIGGSVWLQTLIGKKLLEKAAM
jgi:hypothetical protein